MSQLMSVVFPKGFKVGAGRGGLKRKGDDVILIAAEVPCAAAGVFTTNRMCAAPVKLSRRLVATGRARAVVANAGNANAATGAAGMRDAQGMCALAAEALSCGADEILVASTGVIGRPLDMEKVRAGIEAAASRLAATSEAAAAAARAIMTTDTQPKAAQREISVGGCDVRMGAIAKGAGMISPRMATMLAFITTDAKIEPRALKEILAGAASRTFNRVTVDGDMSTNDTLIALASGLSAAPEIAGGEARARFAEAIEEVCLELAKAIAADGEGATKFVEVRVSGAADDESALIQARAIANSPLVKTALFGCDPNWGRVLAAAGYAGVPFEEEKAVLAFNGVTSFAKGSPEPPSDALRAAMEEKEIIIELDLGLGEGRAAVYTCDYSYDYIRVNAEYHT